MANIYKTANGKIVNMDNLRLANEQEPAVGNMNVNARGDEIASDGSIITPKKEIMKQHYHNKLEADNEFNQKER
jgi:hypothetical protein